VSEPNSEHALDPERFQTEDCTANGVRQVYVREGAGGTPLLLLDGVGHVRLGRPGLLPRPALRISENL
jgi:hypothetical protein